MAYQYNPIDTPDVQSMFGGTTESVNSFSHADAVSFVQPSLPEFVKGFANEDENLVLSRESLRNMFNTLEKVELIELLTLSVMHSPDVRSFVGYTLSNMTAFRRLLVRNIAFHSTTDDVRDMLSSRFGMIEEGSVVYDRSTGKSKGFAFMTFATVESACSAIVDSNKGLIEMSGRPLLLKFAADRVDAINASIKTGTPEHDSELTSPVIEKASSGGRRLFISGLSPVTTSESLTLALSPYGLLDECFVVCDTQGLSRRFGFATFSSEESAWTCLQHLPGKAVDGQLVFAQLANDNRKQRPAPSTPPTRSSELLYSNLIGSGASGIDALWGEDIREQFQYL